MGSRGTLAVCIRVRDRTRLDDHLCFLLKHVLDGALLYDMSLVDLLEDLLGAHREELKHSLALRFQVRVDQPGQIRPL